MLFSPQEWLISLPWCQWNNSAHKQISRVLLWRLYMFMKVFFYSMDWLFWPLLISEDVHNPLTNSLIYPVLFMIILNNRLRSSAVILWFTIVKGGIIKESLTFFRGGLLACRIYLKSNNIGDPKHRLNFNDLINCHINIQGWSYGIVWGATPPRDCSIPKGSQIVELPNKLRFSAAYPADSA